MPSPLVPRQALCNYHPVQYSHFSVEPGWRRLLTADPWGFLRVYLTEEVSKHKPRQRWLNAVSFLNLAEGFYDAANHAQHPTKSVLVYYSLLNLMKVVVSTRGKITFGQASEHHGLTLGTGKSVNVNCSSDQNQRNIFYEFSKCLGVQPKTTNFDLSDLTLNIPEIHELANSLLGKPRRFVPIKIEFVVDERPQGEKPKYLWTRLVYEKQEENQTNKLRSKVLRGKRGEYFSLDSEDSEKVVFKSNSRKSLKHTAKNWQQVYSNICKEYGGFDIFSLLTREGYRYYINIDDPELPPLCYPVLLCFYLGSISRYRPNTLDEIMTSEFGPIVNEALTICPKQFIYQIAGLVTNRVAVVPRAHI